MDPSPEKGPQELVDAARGGDGAAFCELVRRHQRRIYALALRMGGEDALAQDVVQDTFLAAWRALPGFRGDSAFETWIYRIAIHEARRALRRRRPVADVDLEEVLPKFAPNGHFAAGMESWAVDGDRAVQGRQLADAIAEALPRLPERYREAFVLRDVEDLSMQEISEVLDLTVPAVKTRIHRARLMVRALLAERFGDGGAGGGAVPHPDPATLLQSDAGPGARTGPSRRSG